MTDRRENPQPLLLIDDDAAFSGFIANGLKRAGLPTTVASTGQSGLEALHTGRYPLVLLDLVLPDIDGLEVLRRVKTWRPAPSVILLSGLGSIRTAVEAIRLGALDFLEKPLMVADLVDTVRSHLPVVESESDSEDSALHDLVRWVVSVVEAQTDTRTIDEWAHRAGASAAVIFSRCRKVGLHAKSLLDLGRLLRIVVLPPPKPPQIVDALRSRDIRTVGALLERAGLRLHDLQAGDAEGFLATQALIGDSDLLDLLKRAVHDLGPPEA